ncbi:MAG: T9SS type A sorting domain-containing protein [Bacteroidales bacterium]|jgi:hypothetical protein|nr:T9SS type A sorting domain-containing protein [Bacteroidales bacterium]MCK9498951.1 T9SS type A sorting domain-containing protein [Bacteroidales bacterium]MDY0313470.1 T9SS type A sorting domain-containing protein [Bacteroidales bacterium]NLB85643.1 T9SS type A sorting domain-containing protein [Bacteroidales bacterium]
MRYISVLLFFLICFNFLKAQQVLDKEPFPQALSLKERFELMSLPDLKLPSAYKNKSIPIEVDNSLKIYYPGMFHQNGLSCGQVACVGFGFTYEINRKRNLNGSLIQNKYPTYFSWNWENGGNGWYGASYFHTLSLLKKVGNPNMLTYGGSDNFGGGKRWMTGYENYYESMQNRISAAYSIDCSSEEGIMTLKHWLNDHLDGSEDGGIGFFYSQYASPPTVLPSASPHAGEGVFPVWGSSPSHAYTVVGYNDLVRYDINGDGLFTNHLDINGDGIVDIKDWEIGAFKVVNAYATEYTAWALYSSFAKPSTNGGIWNSTVNVLEAISEYSPSLTYKVNMYYNKRNKIKIMTGFSKNINADQPDFYMSFPIIDNQGDAWGLQGEYEEEFRYLEFGLDVSPFLDLIESETNAKFFFQIYENDTNSSGYGRIINFALIDYTSGTPVEYISDDTEINIIDNGITTASVVMAPNYQKPQILTESLPNADVYHDYSFQMQANNGKPPYRWEFNTDYTFSETDETINLPSSQLYSSFIDLPFEFNYYGKTYNKIYVNNRGFIDFTDLSTYVPYNSNEHNSHIINFENKKAISAFNSKKQNTVFYQIQSDYCVLRWLSDSVDVCLKLKDDGEIRIFYNNCISATYNNWVSGLSNGDFLNLNYTPISGGIGNFANIGYVYSPMQAPDYFNISENGLLSGIPTDELVNYPLHFKVTDAGGIVNRKTIPISTQGLIVNISLPNNNTGIEWGSTNGFNLIIKNVTETPLSNVEVKLSCDNPNLSFVNDTYVIYLLNPGQEIIINPAFNFSVNYNFYNEEIVNINVNTLAGPSSWEFVKQIKVYTANISLTSYFVDDSDNNRLDIGETSDVIFSFKNFGNAHIGSFNISISSEDEYLTINQNLAHSNGLNQNQVYNAVFNFTTHENTPLSHVVELNVHISSEIGYEQNIIAYLGIGQIIENWETGDFTSFNWQEDGNLAWTISESDAYEGNYCLRSGAIGNSQLSVLEFDVRVLADGNISFYRKVSCEDGSANNWDYLAFFIDDQEKARWDGELGWENVSFPVQAGIRNFKWVYRKDVTAAAGEDAAWIDLIEFPPIYDPEPLLVTNPNEIYQIMLPDQVKTEGLIIQNLGGGKQKIDVKIIKNPNFYNNQKSLLGSDIVSDGNSFIAGDSVAWTFTLTNRSPDNEWIKGVNLVFPQAFIVDSLSYFIDSGNDTLELISGELGSGGEFQWFGEKSGWGMIAIGETASLSVYGFVNEDFVGDLTVNYTIIGDVYGAEPHNVSGNIVFQNVGTAVYWLKSDIKTYVLGLDEEVDLLPEFNTSDLEEGEYFTNIIIFSNYDTIYLPVNLVVDASVEIKTQNNNDFVVYPNPASNIVYVNSDFKINKLTIFNSLGQIVFSEYYDKNIIELDISAFNKGVYFISCTDKEKLYYQKLIVK